MALTNLSTMVTPLAATDVAAITKLITAGKLAEVQELIAAKIKEQATAKKGEIEAALRALQGVDAAVAWAVVKAVFPAAQQDGSKEKAANGPRTRTSKAQIEALRGQILAELGKHKAGISAGDLRAAIGAADSQKLVVGAQLKKLKEEGKAKMTGERGNAVWSLK